MPLQPPLRPAGGMGTPEAGVVCWMIGRRIGLFQRYFVYSWCRVIAISFSWMCRRAARNSRWARLHDDRCGDLRADADITALYPDDDREVREFTPDLHDLAGEDAEVEQPPVPPGPLDRRHPDGVSFLAVEERMGISTPATPGTSPGRGAGTAVHVGGETVDGLVGDTMLKRAGLLACRLSTPKLSQSTESRCFRHLTATAFYFSIS